MNLISEDTARTLSDLIEVNVDSYKGFETAAEFVEPDALATVMRELAVERRAFVAELESYANLADEAVSADGTTRAKMHRWWVGLKARLESEHAAHERMLDEVHRAEEKNIEIYRDALDGIREPRVRKALEHQYSRIMASHRRLAELCEGAKRPS